MALRVVALACSAALVAFVVAVLLLRPSSSSPRRTFPSTPPPMLSLGSAAPDFSVGSLGDGPPVTLSAWRGQPVILSFFASWCSHCQAELAAFATTARTAAGRVVVVGIDTNDGDGQAAQRLLRRAGASYAVGVDPKGTVAAAYKITALPTTYFLTAQGRVEGVAFGEESSAGLARWVRQLSASTGRRP